MGNAMVRTLLTRWMMLHVCTQCRSGWQHLTCDTGSSKSSICPPGIFEVRLYNRPLKRSVKQGAAVKTRLLCGAANSLLVEDRGGKLSVRFG